MKITRRFFLQSSGALATYYGLAPVGFATQEETVAADKTLVVVFLRGGADGLNLVVPYASDAYYRLRGWMAVPRPGRSNGALDLDGEFGLNPAAAPLLPFFDAGSGVALHAVGHPRNSRSHFEEQDVWETGVVSNTVHSDGWLNRHLQTSQGHGSIRAVGLGETLPRVLRGDASALAIRGLSELSLGSKSGGDDAMFAALERASRGSEGTPARAAKELLEKSNAETIEATRTLRQALEATPKTTVAYPDNTLGRRMREAATLIRTGVGVEVINVDFGGWDTHRSQGAQTGPYTNLVKELSGALSAFLDDLEDRMGDVLVLVVSEFGRTAAINGTAGTDHGWGNCALAFGGPVLAANRGNPRKLIGHWPGLERGKLNEGRDLRHTTDFRDLFAEAVGGHLGNERLTEVLPEHEFKRVGLI
jgi:uncharacterized protein (DUF1501 family)